MVDLLMWAVACGLGCWVSVVLEYHAVPDWEPRDYGVLITYSLGSITVLAWVWVWAWLSGQLLAALAVTLIGGIGGCGTLSAYALRYIRRTRGAVAIWDTWAAIRRGFGAREDPS